MIIVSGSLFQIRDLSIFGRGGRERVRDLSARV